MTHEATKTGGLTEEQRRPLEVRTVSVALGAGAGCGKTTVLTERFLDEIEGKEGRPLRALVAVTFTKKAARELRQRIRARCRQRLAAGEDSTRWRSVLRALEAAPIGTFHEFSAGLLRAHAIEIGVDPDFVVLDEDVASSLRDRAIRTALRRMLADRQEDLMSLGVDYGLRQIREALGTLLSSRTAADLESWSEIPSAELVDRWSRVWQEQGRPAVLQSLAPLARCCRELLSVVQATAPKLRERRAELLLRLPSLEQGTCSAVQLDEIRALARVSDLAAKGIWPAPEIKAAVKRVFESLRNKIDKVQKNLTISQPLTLESAENSLRLLRLASLARGEYEAVKSLRRGLDFDDLLVKTRDLLAAGEGPEHPSLAARESIEFVLVDEFQDTDRIQSEILQRLGDSGFFRGRMFVVGDTKQSIYRFRGAEPAIFGRWRGEFPEPGRLSLTENFRSVPGVIDFVNALFAECFAESDPQAPERRGDHRLAAIRPDQSPEPAVTFLWVLPSPPDEEGAQESVQLSSSDRRTNEARCLARWVRDRLDAGWIIVDRQSGLPRRAHAGDVAFLFRAMTDVWYYETALADLDFDYHSLGGSAFYAQQEVRDVVNVLSVVEDPLDEVALAGALRSSFFSISDDALFWLARAFDGGLTEGVFRAGEIPHLSDRDRACAIRARDLLDRWRGLKDRIPLASLVGSILEESGFEAALVCEFLGSRKLANTRKLIRLAREFDRQESFTLADLVARLRADLDNPPREEQAATTDLESPTLRLMSIHQAKGLEFAIVVIPDLNRKPNQHDPLLGLHPELGLVVRPPRSSPIKAEADAEANQGESLGWLAFQAIEAEEDRREALRLFYVAATRARDHLVLSAGFDAKPETGDPAAEVLAAFGSCCTLNPAYPKAASPALQLLFERFDWRTGSCLARLPDGWSPPRVSVVLATPRDTEEKRPRQSPRRRLPQIERAITGAVVGKPPPDAPTSPRPRLVDLDPEPETPSRAFRLGRLIRAVFADRGLLEGQPLDEVCARAAARQVPASSASLREEAMGCLEPWLDTPLFRELRDASRARRRVERNLRWMIPWPPEETAPTVIRGRCDLIFRDPRGNWRPVIVHTHPADLETDLLRLLLSAAAADRCGKSPCDRPRWVQAIPGQELLVEAYLGPERPAIDLALERWLHRRRRPGLATETEASSRV
jgi:ATP-dependent helicase/nuclease subunit A